MFMKIEVEAEETLNKKVPVTKSPSPAIYVPKHWEGRKILIILEKE